MKEDLTFEKLCKAAARDPSSDSLNGLGYQTSDPIQHPSEQAKNEFRRKAYTNEDLECVSI